MNISIKPRNKKRIIDLLESEQLGKKARLISYDNIMDIVSQLDGYIDKEIIVTYLPVRFHFHKNETPFTYKWAVMTTHITLEKYPGDNHWSLIECKRIDTVPGKGGDRYFIQRIAEGKTRIQNLKGKPLLYEIDKETEASEQGFYNKSREKVNYIQN